jgi:DNA-binding response OmpR family regulator
MGQERDLVMRERTRRIIVINDDTDFLTLMSELLTEIEGYDVQICRESDHAYRFVKEQQPELVILDIRLDGQERGWAILECLTLDPRTSTIPVIVCSAAIRELQAHAAELERYGIDALSKPFDLDALLEKVAEALARGDRRGRIVGLDGEAMGAVQAT